jgi:hypothetical protein
VDEEMMNLDRLDAEIARIGKLLKISRECRFTHVIAAIERELAQDIIPAAAALLAATDGEERKMVAERCRRLERLLSG